MWSDKNRTASSARRPLERRSRRGRPAVETLEGRALLTVSFSPSSAFQILGSDVSIDQVATDAQGNAYVVGSYQGVANFGKDAVGTTYEKTNNNGTDEAFVAKYASNGTLDWFTEFSPQSDGSSSSDASTLVVNNQTVYVAGTFTGNVDFDPFGPGDLQPSSDPVATDGYIVGLSASTGHVANQVFDDFAATYSDQSGNPSIGPNLNIAVDSTGGNVYVTGDYMDAALKISNMNGSKSDTLASAPSSTVEGFVAMFNQDLSLQWAVNPTNQGDTYNSAEVTGIASDVQNGIVYIVGNDDSTSSDGVDSDNDPGASYTRGYVEVISDLDGSWINTDVLNATQGTMYVSGVASDPSGNAYVVGSFSNTLQPTSTSASLVSAGGVYDENNAFIVKFDNNLNEIWQNRFGSSNGDTGDDVAVDAAGNVYMSGGDSGPCSFGNSTVVLRNNSTSTDEEGYVIEIDGNGSYASGFQATGTGTDPYSEFDSLAVSPYSGQIAVEGYVSSPVSVGNVTLSNPSGNSFIASLAPANSGSGGSGSGGSNSGGSGSGSSSSGGSGSHGSGGSSPGGSSSGGSSSGGSSSGNSNGGSQSGGSTTTVIPPVFVGEQRIYAGRGRHKKLVGFQLAFNGALNAGLAQSTGMYQVTQVHGRRSMILPVLSAGYNSSTNAVTLTVAGFKVNKPGQVTITGLLGANRATIAPIATGL